MISNWVACYLFQTCILYTASNVSKIMTYPFNKMRLFMHTISMNVLPLRDQRKNKTESNEKSYT